MAARRKSQKGMATIEVLPIIVVFLMLIGYSLGFFGIVHSGILQSIGARAYAFETFRNRTSLVVFRDEPGSIREGKDRINYQVVQNRVHAIKSDTASGDIPVATARPLSFGRASERVPASTEVHNKDVLEIEQRNRKVKVSPAWIMVGYGICLNAQCGD
jgi:hypothetical protein